MDRTVARAITLRPAEGVYANEEFRLTGDAIWTRADEMLGRVAIYAPAGDGCVAVNFWVEFSDGAQCVGVVRVQRNACPPASLASVVEALAGKGTANNNYGAFRVGYALGDDPDVARAYRERFIERRIEDGEYVEQNVKSGCVTVRRPPTAEDRRVVSQAAPMREFSVSYDYAQRGCVTVAARSGEQAADKFEHVDFEALIEGLQDDGPTGFTVRDVREIGDGIEGDSGYFNPTRIWVGTVSHRHGANTYAAWDRLGLEAQIAAYCRENQNDSGDTSMRDMSTAQIAALPNDEVVRRYFDGHEDEFVSIEAVELPGRE